MVKDYGDFSSWTACIVYYEIFMSLWGPDVKWEFKSNMFEYHFDKERSLKADFCYQLD